VATKTKKKAAKTPPSRKRNDQSVKNIKRIDSTKTHGWQVHVRRGGVLKTKLFSDRVHGGKRKALVAAKEYRDELLDDMAHLAKPLWKIDRKPKTNTGELGASKTEYTNRSGKKRTVITVTVREALGKPVNRKFSVDKLGYKEALKQAVAWRNEVLAAREAAEEGGSPIPPKPKAAPKPKAKAAAKPKAKTAAKPKAKTAPKPKAKTAAKPKTKAAAKPKAKAASKPKPKPKAKVAAKSKAKPKTKPKAKAKVKKAKKK
tara:strand:+ start:14708 stop:15484 length:777 start_codon:yes stop_codon:yes gene_type:complete